MPIVFLVAPVDVCNESLGLLGKAKIGDLDVTTDPVAVDCKQYFGSLLHTMLRDHPWNFCDTDAELAQSIDAPIIDFAYKYALPADCVRVNAVNGDDNRRAWKVRGRFIHSNETTIIISYNTWVDDPNQWNGDFRQAFVTLLASRLATALNSDLVKSNDLYKLYLEQLSTAKATDGQENPSEQMVCTALDEDIRET
jgi:hypothetical protein